MMKAIKHAAMALCLGTMAVFPGAAGADEAISIAVDSYIYGYPLVTFDMVRRQQTNLTTPDAEHAPMGQLIKMRTYPAVDNRCCAAPNADTLYTEVWLDVSKEPWILSIPDMGDRSYIMPMLDGWSEVFNVAGSRTTGGKAQTYAVTGPGWSGMLPQGVTQVSSPSGMVWILGRIYSTGTPEDYKAVHALQDKFSVVPLSAYGKPYTPSPGVVDPGFDMNTAVRKQVNALDVDAYFSHLAKLMKTNPPTADAPIIARMARIGLVPGQDFDPGKLGFLDREAIMMVPKLAVLEMGLSLKREKTTNGWLYFTKGVGNFGTDYLLRGIANLLGPGWNRPQDAVYPLSQKDANDDEYDGAKHNYVVRFEKGQLPPAEAQRAARVEQDAGPVAPGVVQYTSDLLFHELWLRPALAPRDRSLVTVSALIASGQVAQITYHLNRAMDNGLTKAQASEMLTQLAFYAGWPNVFSAIPVVKGVLEKRPR